MTGPDRNPTGYVEGELAFVERLRRMLPSAPEGQTWIGDDAAVLEDNLLLGAFAVTVAVKSNELPTIAGLGATSKPVVVGALLMTCAPGAEVLV